MASQHGGPRAGQEVGPRGDLSGTERQEAAADLEVVTASTMDAAEVIHQRPTDIPLNSHDIRRRQNATVTTASVSPAAAVPATTPIMTPPPTVAGGVIVGLVALIVTLVVVRNETSNPSRALEFLTNMTIAGVVIFGVSGSLSFRYIH